MNYPLIKELVDLAQAFELDNQDNRYRTDIKGFKTWLTDERGKAASKTVEPAWEGKEKGRSPESAISTMIVHLNRYAKTYSRSAIYNSSFSTQDDFIYLINLQAFGPMTKAELIKRNIHDKPSGMQIINRLIKQKWISQTDSTTDKRSKVVSLTPKGEAALMQQMDHIRTATKIVSGDLSHSEKMELIHLLTKLCTFHQQIYTQRIDSAELLQKVQTTYPIFKNMDRA